MPLGDSITQWQCGTLGNATHAANGRGDVASFGGYRGPLFEGLQEQWGSLYRFESVGGQHGCGSHEGPRPGCSWDWVPPVAGWPPAPTLRHRSLDPRPRLPTQPG